MNEEFTMIISSTDSYQRAKEIGRLIVRKRLAACYQMQRRESIYQWKGRVTEEGEYQICIKTQPKHYEEIEKILLEKTGYQVPEIIQVPITNGYKTYLDWITSCVRDGDELTD